MARKRDPRPYNVTVVRYELPDGRRCRKGDPGARPVRTRTETWYADLPDEAGVPRRTSLETTDQGQAWVELRRRQREAELRARGIVDVVAEQAARPLAAHIAEWEEVLRAKGISPKQVHMLLHSARHLAELAGWKRPADITRDTALLALARLCEERDSYAPEGRGAQTRNHHLSYLKQFCNWLVEGDRLARNPVTGLRPVPVDADRRHDRRAPNTEEVARLYAYLEGPDAAVIRGMTGHQRGLAYKVGLATGFRAGEIRSLTPESFDLEKGEVVCRAAYDKRRRMVTQKLPPWLAAELREWFAGGGGCWQGFPHYHPGQVLKADLEAAGVPYVTEGPEGPLYFDMHSLRHWYCTEMAGQPDIDIKTLQVLCRHSSPALTIKRYAKSRDGSLRAAVDRLPPVGTPPPAQPPRPKDTEGPAAE